MLPCVSRPRSVELLHLPLGALERLADRPHETVDRLLARRELAFGALVLHAQLSRASFRNVSEWFWNCWFAS